MSHSGHEIILEAGEYHLSATLSSGQAFRWARQGEDWLGVIHGRRVRLRQQGGRIIAQSTTSPGNWRWLTDYLQVEADLAAILATFPTDETTTAAVNRCRGLRLLRQEPWECLASFILSSTKQIVQIQQIVTALCDRWGSPIDPFAGEGTIRSFPTAAQLAVLTEADLRSCKMGFRAPYLLATARMVASGECDLERIRSLPLPLAREELLKLPGVGDKIANCVLLFAYGFPTAFPVDVWMLKALKQYYFRRRRLPPARLREVAVKHFGPQAGYAQQYLFHWIRLQHQKELSG